MILLREIERYSDFINKRDCIVNRKMTVSEAMNSYIESRKNVLEETTSRDYNQVLKYRFKSIMDMKLTDLQPIHIQQAINFEAESVSPKP